MTTPAAPACDFCTEESAIMSVMNLGNYDQQLIGQDCLPAFLLGLLRMIAPSMVPADPAPNGDGPADTPPADGPPAEPPGPPEGGSAPLPKRQPRARKGTA